jgi:hypothetical protein
MDVMPPAGAHPSREGSWGQSLPARWSSGEYGGWKTRWTPSGTRGSFALCQPAPSRTAAARLLGPRATSPASSCSTAPMMAVETVSPVCGRTKENR